MSRRRAILNFFLWAVLSRSTEAAGQQGLEAKLARTSLPNPLLYSSAVYDGVDNVYIFGG
jgi:hypothetical protein